MRVMCLILALVFSLKSEAAFSITLDDFSTPDYITYKVAEVPNISNKSGKGILGSKRYYSTYLQGSGAGTVEIRDGELAISSSDLTSIYSTISWKIPRKFKKSELFVNSFSFNVKNYQLRSNAPALISAVIKRRNKSNKLTETVTSSGYSLGSDITSKKFTVKFEKPIPYSMISSVGISISIHGSDITVSDIRMK